MIDAALLGSTKKLLFNPKLSKTMLDPYEIFVFALFKCSSLLYGSFDTILMLVSFNISFSSGSPIKVCDVYKLYSISL